MDLTDLLTSSTTIINADVSGWKQEIMLAGNLLEAEGDINHEYSQDMVKLVSELGPYIVVMPGIALAHARPNGNVIRNKISLITTKEGISFGHKANDPVYVMFAIAAITDEDHLKIFQLLANFLQNESNIRQIRNAKKFADINFGRSKNERVA